MKPIKSQTAGGDRSEDDRCGNAVFSRIQPIEAPATTSGQPLLGIIKELK